MSEGINPNLILNSTSNVNVKITSPSLSTISSNANTGGNSNMINTSSTSALSSTVNPVIAAAATATANNQRYRYQNEIQAMMYTFGDVKNPLSTTALLIEDIVHSQILELLITASAVVNRRGARSIAPEDLLFLIRHDINRSSRLKEFLCWKDVRKNAKPAGATGGTSTNPNKNDDSALVAEIEDDAKNLAADVVSKESGTSSIDRSNSASKAPVQLGPKRRQIGLFWDLGHSLTSDLPPTTSGSTDLFSIISFDSNEQEVAQRDTLRRLRQADLRTISMTQAEYLEYSECRQASFTFKKGRKFREWLTGGTARPGGLNLTSIASGSTRDLARFNDDTLEILGFLAYEMVQKLTEVSLAVKYESECLERQKLKDCQKAQSQSTTTTTHISANSSLGGIFSSKLQPSSLPVSYTNLPSISTHTTKSKTPIQVQHVDEGYRRLMAVNVDPFHLFSPGLNKRRKFLL